jgi:dTDP-4-dehydrorhamnose 3,5-epimerase
MNEFKEEIAGVRVWRNNRHHDARGWLQEIYRDDELPASFYPSMAYVSAANPGVVRGPHEHEYQTDCFAFFGPGDFELTLWDARNKSPTYGHKQVMRVGECDPAVVLVPPGVVHAYKNVSNVRGMVFNTPDALYAGWKRKEPVDEIRHELDPHTPYKVD